MSAKHTPGPWKSTGAHFGIPTSSGKFSMINLGRFHSRDEAKCNARLVAAAPDLLEALKRVFEDGPNLDEIAWADACDKARAAIAKATGDEA